MNTLESRKTHWMMTSAAPEIPEQARRHGATAPLSLRARFDLATLVTAGVASTVFFLLPVWAPIDRSADLTATAMQSALILAPGPVVDPTNATLLALATVDVYQPAPHAEPTRTRSVRPPQPAPALVPPRAPAREPQSKLARLLLGDGRERVQPFPRPASRAAR